MVNPNTAEKAKANEINDRNYQELWRGKALEEGGDEGKTALHGGT